MSLRFSQRRLALPVRSTFQRAWRRCLAALVLGSAAPLAGAATEAELRAAVIFNIARFVQWPMPASAAPGFDICTVGESAVSEALAALTGKTLNDKLVAVRTIKRDRDVSGCHVVYINADSVVHLAAISAALSESHEPALTISEAPSFLALGGMVQLVVVNERLRFRINRPLAERTGLNINAKLLQLALPGID